MTFHGETTLVSVSDTPTVLASLSEVKASMRVETSDEDAFINQCMAQAKTFLESTLDRKLDGATYKVKFKFDNCPHPGDKLWLSPAPIKKVTAVSGVVPTSTYNGFVSFVSFQDGWETDELELTVSTEFSAALIDNAFKLPFLTVVGAYFRYREFTLARQPAINTVVYDALRPYIREV